MFQFADQDVIKVTFESKDAKEIMFVDNLKVSCGVSFNAPMRYHVSFNRCVPYEQVDPDPEIIRPGDKERIEFYKKNLVGFECRDCGCIFASKKYDQKMNDNLSTYCTSSSNHVVDMIENKIYTTKCPCCGKKLTQNEKLSFETYKRLKENYTKGEGNG